MNPFFQAGIVVPDLNRAMEELSTALDLRWGTPLERQVGEWPLWIVFSLDGPPYLELIEGPAGSPWDAAEGSRLDHLGWWSDDLDSDRERLEAVDVSLEVDGRPLGGFFHYFRAPSSGLRIELVASSGRTAFSERWGLKDPDR